MFVVLLQYPNPDALEPHRAAHIAWVEANAAKGIFLFSGPMIPRSGGVIIANAASRDDLAALLRDDPYRKGGTQYTIHEFDAKLGALAGTI